MKYLAEVHGIVVQPSTMARRFCRGGGPPAHLAGGRKPLYPVRELDAWAERYLGPLCSRSSDGRRTVGGHVP